MEPATRNAAYAFLTVPSDPIEKAMLDASNPFRINVIDPLSLQDPTLSEDVLIKLNSVFGSSFMGVDTTTFPPQLWDLIRRYCYHLIKGNFNEANAVRVKILTNYSQMPGYVQLGEFMNNCWIVFSETTPPTPFGGSRRGRSRSRLSKKSKKSKKSKRTRRA
jgi:hypothetical protein